MSFMDKKPSYKRVLEENRELQGSLQAFGRLEVTIQQMERQLLEKQAMFMVMTEYVTELGGTPEVFQKRYKDAMKKATEQDNPTETPPILGLDGKPIA